MYRSISRVVALASSIALFVSSVSAQTTAPEPTPATNTAAGAVSTLGCFSTPTPLASQGDYTFQTPGYCQTVCVQQGKPVMAITGGSTCYCGDEMPSLSYEVDLDKCNSPCNGYDQLTCGGIGFWQLYLTGLGADVQYLPNITSSTSSSGSTSQTSAPSTATRVSETVVVTQPAQTPKSSSGGPSKVGIAVGVVVGVIAIAAIAGGILLWMRHKRNRDIEEEHRRNAAVSSFIGSQKSDKSSNDARLDPSIYSHRRESIGSIADERDFSRRILQVRNPDRDSKQSNLQTQIA